MTLLRPAPVAIRQLDWIPAERRFSADMSSLNGFARVWDDACDEGFTIVGATGREVVFAVWEVSRDAEGDILFWSLSPADPDDRADVRSVIVYND